MWNNVVFTYNQSYITAYVNGAKTGTAVINGVITNTSELFCIGAKRFPAGSSNNPFTGDVVNVQLYNVSLTAAQAYVIYSAGTGGAPMKGIVDWWPLDGDTNDYVGYYYAYTYGTVPFVSQLSTPPGLTTSYQVSRASVPLVLGVNGIYNTYQVGVVTWS